MQVKIHIQRIQQDVYKKKLISLIQLMFSDFFPAPYEITRRLGKSVEVEAAQTQLVTIKFFENLSKNNVYFIKKHMVICHQPSKHINVESTLKQP